MPVESIKNLKTALAFSANQGSTCAIITTQEDVRGVIVEVEQLDEINKLYFAELEALKTRVALLDWVKENVLDIDFFVKVPSGVLSTNPWIAVGQNFEVALAKAKAQLDMLT